MAYQLSEEQKTFQQMLRDFFGTACELEWVKKNIEAQLSLDSELRAELGKLELHSFFCVEEKLSSAFRFLSLIAFEQGRVLSPVAVAEELLVGEYAFFQLFSKSQRRKVLPTESIDQLQSGKFRVSVAIPTVSLDRPLKIRKRNNQQCYLTGQIDSVWGTYNAPWLLVSVPSNHGADRLVLIDHESQSAKVRYDCQSSIDLSQAAYSIDLNRCLASSLDPKISVQIFNHMRVLKALELAGICSRVIEMTSEYVKTRKQFETPIGSFQAVQHKLAQAYAESEGLAALGQFAAWAADESPEQYELAARAALSYGCRVAPLIVESAIQLHGGVGFTWEYPLHHFLRRVKKIEVLWSEDSSQHARILELAKRSARV